MRSPRFQQHHSSFPPAALLGIEQSLATSRLAGDTENSDGTLLPPPSPLPKPCQQALMRPTSSIEHGQPLPTAALAPPRSPPGTGRPRGSLSRRTPCIAARPSMPRRPGAGKPRSPPFLVGTHRWRARISLRRGPCKCSRTSSTPFRARRRWRGAFAAAPRPGGPGGPTARSTGCTEGGREGEG